MKLTKVLGLTLSILIFTVRLNATTILIQKPEVIFRAAPLIVQATVKDISFRPTSNSLTGHAVITLAVHKVLVGNCENELSIKREFVSPDLNFLESEWLPTYSIGENFLFAFYPQKAATVLWVCITVKFRSRMIL